MTRGRVTVALAALTLALAAGPLAAQAPADTLTLTVDEAIAIAEGANPAYLRAENALALNGPETRATWLGEIVPQVNLSLLNTGYGGRLTRIGTDDFGNPLPNPDASWFYDSYTSSGLSANWTLRGPSFLTARSRLRQSRASRAVEVGVARAQMRADVRSQYHEALEQGALLEVEETLAAAREIDLESTRRLFSLAQASQVDVLNAEVQVEQQAQAINQQRRRYEQALLALRTTLGDPSLPPLRLVGEEAGVFDPQGLDAEVLVERAVERSPVMDQARAAVDGARISVDEATAWKWPTLSLQYNLSRYVQTRETAALLDLGYDPDQVQSSFQIQLSVPFFNNHFENRYQEAQADVQLANQREALKERRLEVERTVRSELVNLRNQYESLRLAERTLAIAGRASELAREEYRLGTRTFEQLQQTVSAEADARRQVIQARFAFVDARIALEQAVGAPVGPEN